MIKLKQFIKRENLLCMIRITEINSLTERNSQWDVFLGRLNIEKKMKHTVNYFSSPAVWIDKEIKKQENLWWKWITF